MERFPVDFGRAEVELLFGSYIRCWPEWSDYDYLPDYSKFYFIRGGECELVVGGQAIRPRRGQLVLMPAGVRQSYYHINQNYVEKYWCHFRAEIGGQNLFSLIEAPLCVDVPDCAGLEALFETMFARERGGGLSDILEAKAALLAIICLYLRESGARLREPFHTSAGTDFFAVTDFIHRNLGAELTVAGLAEIAHLHPNYFASVFRQHFGCPPMKYVSAQRIEAAKRLLTTDSRPVSEIAAVTGFGDLFYFSRAFKKATGISPTRFRQTQSVQRSAAGAR